MRHLFLIIIFVIPSLSHCQRINFWWLQQKYGCYLGNKKIGIEIDNSFTFCHKNIVFEAFTSYNHSKGIFVVRHPGENLFSFIGHIGYRFRFNEKSSMTLTPGIGYITGTTQGDFKNSQPAEYFIGLHEYYSKKTISTGILSAKMDFQICPRTVRFALTPGFRVMYFNQRTYFSAGIGISIGTIVADF